MASLKLQYSSDCQNWIDITEMTCESIEKSHTFEWDFNVADIQEGNVYIRAYAYDGAGNESDCNGVPVENSFIVDRTAPAKINNMKAEGMSGYVSLSWDKPTEDDLQEFEVYRAEEEVGNYVLIASKLTTNIYYDTTAVFGTVYHYKVRALDQAGNISEFSNEAVAQSLIDDEAPIIQAVSPKDNAVITGKVDITAVVTDNVAVKEVSFEYKPKDSKEDIWSDLGQVSIGESCGYPSVTWDVSKFANKEYDIRIIATDDKNNISNPYVFSYVVDTKAPEAPELTAEAIGYGAKLTWDENAEDDFAYYEVYRRLGNEENYKMVKQITENQFEDSGLKEGRNYIYKVHAFDKAGNYAISNECTIIPTNEDKEPAVAVASENYSVRVGSEVLLDATASHDNVKIKSYEWDMGNGDIIHGAIARYVYKQMGTYKAKLTVKDAAGNSDTTDITIRVRSRISARANIKVVSQIGETNLSMGYAHVYIEDADHIGTNYMADCFGELSVVLDKGTYNVEVYKEGFMPKSFTLEVANGDEKSMVLNLERGQLVTGTLTTERLTLQQILDLGVDIKDPNNWYTYYYTMNFTVPGKPETQKQTVALEPGCVMQISTGLGSAVGGNGNGGGPYYVRLIDVEGKKVVTIYHCVSYLKKMYDVELQVTNNAEEGHGFDIKDATATLNLPAGLSLLKIDKPQSLVNEIGTLEAQKTADTHWYIKADDTGSYDLSATFNGTLMPFEAPVKTDISATEPLNVTKEEDNTFTDDGFADNPVNYVIRVVDKKGEKIKGAIVTLSDGEKQCQTITNNRGTARLEVNPNDGRTFNLSIEQDEFIGISQAYTLKTPSYYDTIIMYRPGESKIEDDKKREEEEEEIEVESPYLEGYDIGIETATYDSLNLFSKTRVWNRAEKKSHSFYFKFTEEVKSYELSLNGKTIETGKDINSDVLQFTVGPDKVKEDGIFGLTVYGTKHSNGYTLKLRSEVNIYETIIMQYGNDITDLLSETYNVYTYYKGTKFTITSNLLQNVDLVVSKFTLMQDKDEIASSQDGKFEVKVNDFKPNKEIYIVAYDDKDEILSKVFLNLCVQKTPELSTDYTLSFASEDAITFTVDRNAPILAGAEFKIDISEIKLPYDLEYTNEGCKVSIGQSTEGGRDKGEKDIWIVPNKLKLTMGVTGSLYGSYDSTKFEGGLQFKIGIEGEWAQQAAVAAIPVVIEVTAKGELTADGTLTLDLSPDAKERLTGAISMLVEVGLELYAGIGISEIASAGIYGAVTFGIGFDILPKAGMSTAYVKGEIGVKAKAFWGEEKLTLLKGTYWLYNPDPNAESCSGESHSLEEISAELADIQNYHLKPRHGMTQPEWKGNRVTDDSNIVQTLQSGIYDGNAPRIITANDRSLLFFNVDDMNQNIANGCKVAYSVYQNGKFSDPVYVNDAEGHAQYAYDVYEDNGNIYLVWQEANKTFEEDASLREMAEAMELMVAKYDSQTGTFTSLGKITTNNIYEANPQICSRDGKVYVTWYENSENDILGLNGKNTLKYAVCNEGTWSQEKNIATDLGSIASIDAGKMTDGVSVAYTENGSSKVTSLENETTQVLPGGSTNMIYGYYNKEEVLTWYNSGVINYMTEVNGDQKALFDDVVIKSNAYSYVSNATGNSSIIYTLTYDGRAQAYISDYDTVQNVWGSPQAVTDQEAYIENASGTYLNGQLILCFHQTTADITEDDVLTNSDLCCMKVGKEAKLVINDIQYEKDQVIPCGDVDLSISVSNNGLQTVKGSDVSYSIQDETGKEIAKTSGTVDIRAGQNASQSIRLRLPSTLSATNYTVVVSFNGNSIEKTFTIGYANLTIQAKVYAQQRSYELEATVKNTGVETASGKVIFYDFYDDSKILAERTFDSLYYDEEQVMTYVVPEEVYNGDNGISIAAKIITDQEQACGENNIAVVYLAPIQSAMPCRVTFDYANPDYPCVKKYFASGDTITFPAEPAVSGYTFLGWFDGDNKYTEENKVYDDMKLVAKYQKNPEEVDSTDPASPTDPSGPANPAGPTTSDTPKTEPSIDEPKVEQKKLLKKNAKQTVDGITYKVVKSSKTKGTVTVYKVKDKKLTTITIPDRIKLSGYTYKVVSVSKNAFKNDTKLKKVIIGKNVASIGSSAFSGCKNLKTIQINSKSVKAVGKNAFKNIYKKAVIKVPSTKLKKYIKLFSRKGQKKTVAIKKK